MWAVLWCSINWNVLWRINQLVEKCMTLISNYTLNSISVCCPYCHQRVWDRFLYDMHSWNQYVINHEWRRLCQ